MKIGIQELRPKIESAMELLNNNSIRKRLSNHTLFMRPRQ